SGDATMKVNRWVFRLGPSVSGEPSNGIDPANELVQISLGEETFLVPAGSFRASSNGKRFAYRSKGTTRGGRTRRISRPPDGAYPVRFTLMGVDLSQLTLEFPICRPFAVIVGDDDGFTGLDLTRHGFNSKRFEVKGFCDVGGDWPWIRG